MGSLDVNHLKELARTDLAAALEQFKELVKEDNNLYNDVIALIGRLEDVSDKDKLLELASNAAERQGGGSVSIENKVLEFYAVHKNRIRMAFMNLLSMV